MECALAGWAVWLAFRQRVRTHKQDRQHAYCTHSSVMCMLVIYPHEFSYSPVDDNRVRALLPRAQNSRMDVCNRAYTNDQDAILIVIELT